MMDIFIFIIEIYFNGTGGLFIKMYVYFRLIFFVMAVMSTFKFSFFSD